MLERRHADLVVQEAVDGVEAIELAKQTKPDLILLDLAMPGLNGVEVATILRNTLPGTPIILFTMYTDLHADSLSHRVQTMKYRCGSGSRSVRK